MARKKKSLDDQILQAIKNEGIMEYMLSKISGVSQAVIARFISRHRDITLRTATKLVDSLDLELRPRKKRGK